MSFQATCVQVNAGEDIALGRKLSMCTGVDVQQLYPPKALHEWCTQFLLKIIISYSRCYGLVVLMA